MGLSLCETLFNVCRLTWATQNWAYMTKVCVFLLLNAKIIIMLSLHTFLDTTCLRFSLPHQSV